MAISSCVRCGNTSFEMVEGRPRGTEWIVMFIQCASCGGVMGVQEYYQTHALLEEQNINTAKFRSTVGRQLDAQTHAIASLQGALGRIESKLNNSR